MATLSAQSVVRAGLEPVMASAAAGGDEFVNTGVEWLEIVNGDASDMTLTIATQATADGLTIADRTVVVTAAERRLVGPFPTGTYNDTNSKVQLTYSAVTSLTIGVFKR